MTTYSLILALALISPTITARRKPAPSISHSHIHLLDRMSSQIDLSSSLMLHISIMITNPMYDLEIMTKTIHRLISSNTRQISPGVNEGRRIFSLLFHGSSFSQSVSTGTNLIHPPIIASVTASCPVKGNSNKTSNTIFQSRNVIRTIIKKGPPEREGQTCGRR